MPTARCASASSSTTAATAGAAPPGTWSLPATASRTYEDLVDEYAAIGNLSPAIVVSVADRSVRPTCKVASAALQIDWDGLSWARKELQNETVGPAPKDAGQVLARGDVVYVVADNDGHAQLAQLPEAQSALVALDPNDGSVVALVGGFDYFTNKYNRVTQARRLPGSGFKPFLYSAALEHGFTPASVILDAPIVLGGNGSEDDWRPENSERAVRRADAPARGAGALAQPGLDPHPQGARHLHRDRLRHPLRLRPARRCRTT